MRACFSSCAFFLAAAAVHASDVEDAELVWSGSIATRAQATAVKEDAISSTRDIPILHGLVEANVQARAKLLDRKLAITADASVFAQHGSFFVDGGEAFYDHDVAEHHPRVVISELVLRYEVFEHLDVSIGKQRVVWGSGIANNPTDVVNPPRDPTDPAFQRTGVWQLKVDVPIDNVTWSAFFAPWVLHSEAGIPVVVMVYPSYAIDNAPKRDNELHWMAGARLYALVADTDLNLWMVWSHLAADAFQEKVRAMGSVSRLVGDEVEVHAEALIQSGSARVYADSSCSSSDDDLVACAINGTAPLAQTKLEARELMPRVLLGARWLPADESILTVEYVYAADGSTDEELDAFYDLQSLVRDRIRRGEPVPAPPVTASDGLPSRIGVDLVRQHTLFVSYVKPRIFDDFTVSSTVVLAPEDLSSILSANVQWSATEWLTLSSFAFAPTPALIRDVGAFDATPFHARFVVEARAFF